MRTIRIYWLAGLLQLGTFMAAAQRAPGSGSDYRLIAHRGGIVDSLAAENSLPALERAIARGYWMVEVDLRHQRRRREMGPAARYYGGGRH